MEEIKKEKQPYYIFMNIGGTLWDIEHIENVHGPFVNGIDRHILKPASVEAMNLLIDSLEEQFDTKLVITSSDRKDFAECVRHLKYNGLKYDKPIFRTAVSGLSRGYAIVDYLSTNKEAPLTYPKLKTIFGRIIYNNNESPNDFKNYVVLESIEKRISKEIPKSRRIITNMHKALTDEQVIDFLTKNNIPFKQEKQNQPQ